MAKELRLGRRLVLVLLALVAASFPIRLSYQSWLTDTNVPDNNQIVSTQHGQHSTNHSKIGQDSYRETFIADNNEEKANTTSNAKSPLFHLPTIVSNLGETSSRGNVTTANHTIIGVKLSDTSRALTTQVATSKTINATADDNSFANSIPYAKNKSSIDYYACCGAGHRLIRMSCAYHLAREIKFGLRGFWGWCDKAEMFNHLFGPEPVEDLEIVTSFNQRTVATNEVGGFAKLRGLGRDGVCQCTKGKIQNDIKFYSSLRDRFCQRQQVADFVLQHFRDAPLVIGMHIRAGNNETGHFTRKGRGINNVTEWLGNVTRHVRSLLHHRRPGLKGSKQLEFNASYQAVVLFVASDTPSIVPRLQSLFPTDSLHVVTFPHVAAVKEGTGVSFGQQGTPTPEGHECILSWEATMIDMMLLSHVDILVSPRYSSFSQSLPLSLVFSQRQERDSNPMRANNESVPPAACFMDYDAVSMKCYDTFSEWCCDNQSLQTVLVKFPNEPSFSNRTWLEIEPRSPNCNGDTSPLVPDCLPYRWLEAPQEANITATQ